MVFFHTICKKYQIAVWVVRRRYLAFKKVVEIAASKNPCLIMDNKTYVKMDFTQVFEQQFYYKFKDKDVKISLNTFRMRNLFLSTSSGKHGGQWKPQMQIVSDWGQGQGWG